jgi:hypothetical protein
MNNINIIYYINRKPEIMGKEKKNIIGNINNNYYKIIL